MPQLIGSKFWNWVLVGFLAFTGSGLVSGGYKVIDHDYRISAVEEIAKEAANCIKEISKNTLSQEVLDQIENNRSDVQSMNDEFIDYRMNAVKNREKDSKILQQIVWAVNDLRIQMNQKTILIEMEEEDLGVDINNDTTLLAQ